jgi:hypothetical protein
VLSAAAIGIGSAIRVYRAGWLLYYSDAESHLNHARRILDSLTPGVEQLGTVWLPLPHLLMLPFAANDILWRTGLAGAIPSTICFIAPTTFLFAATRRFTGGSGIGVAAAAVFVSIGKHAFYWSVRLCRSTLRHPVGVSWLVPRHGFQKCSETRHAHAHWGRDG